MPRNILILCTKVPYPPVDGGTFAMLNMIRGFYKAGHQVTVLSMNTPKHFVTLRQMPAEIRQMAEFHAVEVNTSLNFLDALANLFWGGLFGKSKSYHVARFTSSAFRQELETLLRKNNYDIIQLETLYMTPYIKTIRAFGQNALIGLRAHNIEHEIWLRRANNERNPLKKFYFQVTADRIKDYEQSMIRRNPYDVIVPITKRDADALKKLGASGENMFFCNVGIDKDTLDKERVKMEYPSVFFLGALDWEPNREGLRWFIKYVWPLVHKAYPKVKFYIAGRRIPNEFLKQTKANIEVVGEVKSAPQFIKSKGIMIVPVFSGSGMRVKIIEGMAYSKAIVATKMAIEGIRVKHGDQILLAETPQDFFHCVSILIEERNLYNTIGSHAKKASMNMYDNDMLTGKLLDFYEKKLNE